MSEKKIKCTACERRREQIKIQSIRILRRAEAVVKKVKR